MTPKTHLITLALSLSMAGLWLATFTGASLMALLPESIHQHTGNIGWLAWYIPAVLVAALLLAKFSSLAKKENNGKACRPVFHY